MTEADQVTTGQSIIDTIVPNTVNEIEQEPQNMLEQFTIQELFSKIINGTTTFSDLLEQINGNSTKILREKLVGLFLLLDSQNKIELKDYQEKSRHNNRNIRQVSVLCMLEKIKFHAKKKDETYDKLFKNIYPERLMDVDSFIRLVCLETFGFLCKDNQKTMSRNIEFLKQALNDKADSIRKCALRIIQECFNFKSTTKSMYMKLFRRISEMLEKDKCRIVRNLAAKTIFLYFKAEFIGESDVLKALNVHMFTKTYRNFLITFHNENAIDGNLNEVDLSTNTLKEFGENDFRNYEKYLFHVDSAYMPLTLHFIADKLVEQSISLSNTELQVFIEFVCWKESQGFKCCDKETCYLEVLKITKISDSSLNSFFKLLDHIKGSKNKMKIFADILLKVEINYLVNHAEKVQKVIQTLASEKVNCLELFKMLEKNFHNAIVKALQSYSIKSKIKYFDVTDQLKDKEDAITKSYATFWYLIKGDYEKINELKFHDPLAASEIPEFLEILKFYHKKMIELNLKLIPITDDTTYEIACDLPSSIRAIRLKLIRMAFENVELFSSTQNNAKLFVECINSKVIEKVDNIFLTRSTKNFDIILNLRPKQKIFDILYENLRDIDTNQNTEAVERVCEKLRIIIPKIKKGSVKLFLFFNELYEKPSLEPILIILSPLLKLEDAIVIENKATGKLKDCLAKKISNEEKAE